MAPSAGLSGSKVLVTGASGFIGSHLVLALTERGADIHAVSRRPRKAPMGSPQWWTVDLADEAAVGRLVATVEPDIVFHLASHVSGNRGMEGVLPSFHGNLASTVNLLTAVTTVGCRRIVLAGSLEEPAAGSVDPIPASPYAAAKAAASAYGRMFHALYDTPAVIARLFMVYGPAQQDLRKLVPYTILSLLTGRPLSLSAGTRPVDWIYVKDVVAGLLAMAEAPGVEGQTLDLGTGDLVPVRAIVEALAEMTEPNGQLRFGAIAERPMEQVRAAEVTRSQRLLGWRATTPLPDGLAETVSWYRNQLKDGEIDLSSIA